MLRTRWGPKLGRLGLYGVAIAAASLLGAAPAGASTPLLPGGFALGDGGAPSSAFPGALVASYSPKVIALKDSSGTIYTNVEVRTGVYRHSSSSSTLDFYYQVKNLGKLGNPGETAGPATAIGRVTLSHFAGFSTAVAGRTTTFPGSGPPPSFTAGTSISDFTTRSADGDGIAFNFLSGIAAGVTSEIMIVETNATSFTVPGNVAVQDTGNGNSPSFSPANVPEPSALPLLASALMPFGMMLRTRFRKREDEDEDES